MANKVIEELSICWGGRQFTGACLGYVGRSALVDSVTSCIEDLHASATARRDELVTGFARLG